MLGWRVGARGRALLPDPCGVLGGEQLSERSCCSPLGFRAATAYCDPGAAVVSCRIQANFSFYLMCVILVAILGTWTLILVIVEAATILGVLFLL